MTPLTSFCTIAQTRLLKVKICYEPRADSCSFFSFAIVVPAEPVAPELEFTPGRSSEIYYKNPYNDGSTDQEFYALCLQCRGRLGWRSAMPRGYDSFLEDSDFLGNVETRTQSGHIETVFPWKIWRNTVPTECTAVRVCAKTWNMETRTLGRVGVSDFGKSVTIPLTGNLP